jgi:hypothetical protein
MYDRHALHIFTRNHGGQVDLLKSVCRDYVSVVSSSSESFYSIDQTNLLLCSLLFLLAASQTTTYAYSPTRHTLPLHTLNTIHTPYSHTLSAHISPSVPLYNMGSRARAKRRAAKAENHPPSAVQDIGKRPSIQTQIQGDYHPISSFRCKCLICIRTPLVVAKDRGIPVFVKPKEVVGSGSGCTALFTKLAVKPRYYQPVKK